MPTLYFSHNNPNSINIVQNIIQDCRIALNATCLGPEEPEDFLPQTLNKILSLCDALIIVISKNGSDAKDSESPDCDSTLKERTQLEIETAINLDMMIVPLLLDEAMIPIGIDPYWEYLRKFNPYSLRSAFLQEDFQEVLDDIEEELNFKKDVETRMSLTVDENFERMAEIDAKPGKPFGLESSGMLELRKVVESETIFLKKARGIGDRLAEKNALSALGLAYSRLGQTQRAIDFFLQELDIATELGDSKEQCSLLANLGDASAISGKLDQALKYFEEQKTLATEKGFSAFIGSSYNGLGFVYVKKNIISKAIDCYLKALESYRQQEDHDKVLELLVGIGLNYQKLGDYEDATAFFIQALAKAKYVENRKEEAHILIDLAETYHKLGDLTLLKPVMQQAEELLNARKTNWAPPLINRLHNLKISINSH